MGCTDRFLKDGDLEIDNGATERANRDIAIGRGNWTFFGSDAGGRTAAILMSFIAMCKRNAVEPYAWFRDVLSRIAMHPSTRSKNYCRTSGRPSPRPPIKPEIKQNPHSRVEAQGRITSRLHWFRFFTLRSGQPTARPPGSTPELCPQIRRDLQFGFVS